MVKNIIKKTFYKLIAKDYNDIIDIIKDYDYISFDVFDTLIKRNINNPTNVFELVEILFNNTHSYKLNNFKNLRIEAEQKSRNLDNSNEPNIDDIYNCINLNISKKNIEEIKNLEILLELKLCQKNIDFYPIYEYARKNGKKIIITTDMYLKKDIIEKILANANINYDYIFLSNELKLNKHSGNIYPYIIKFLNIKNNQILHIGDSKRADYLNAKKYKIKSILIPKKIFKLRYIDISKLNNIDENVLYNIINNNLPCNQDIYYKIGYETIGPLLYGYVNWLLKNIKDKNISKIFFLSREGLLLKKAFDIINESNIDSNYLYISRKSSNVSLIKNIDTLDDLLAIIKLRKVATIQSFFETSSLDIKNYNNILKKYSCKKDDNFYSVKEINELFLQVKSDIIKNAQKSESYFLGYLKQEKFSGNIAIADIGWNGTMQNNLDSLLTEQDIKHNIEGFYIGVNNVKNNVNGYLTDFSSIRSCVNLFEKFFLALHGTTIGYVKEKNKYNPLLAKNDCNEKENNIFETIQQGALDCVKVLNECEILNEISLSSFSTVKSLYNLIINPSQSDIKLFANVSYKDDIESVMVKQHNLFYYVLHLKRFYYDFYLSGWKIGFLKNTFKVALPYNKIYDFLKRNKEN